MRSHDWVPGCGRTCSGGAGAGWRVPSERSETGACSIGILVEGLCYLDVDVAVVGWHVEVVASSDKG